MTIFDLKTLKTLGTVNTGTNPDAIVYDGVTKRVFTMNGRSHNATAINAADGAVAGTLDWRQAGICGGGRQGQHLRQHRGQVRCVQFDAQKFKVLNRWPMAPCEEPSGLAMDQTTAASLGCHNKMMAVRMLIPGKVMATPVGEGVDANRFDPETKYAFASNGEGTLTVVHEDSPDKFTVENIPTKRSARTMAMDAKTHNISWAGGSVAVPLKASEDRA